MMSSIYKTSHFSPKFITQLIFFTLSKIIRVLNKVELYSGQSRLSLIVRMNVVVDSVSGSSCYGGGGGGDGKAGFKSAHNTENYTE